MSKNWIWVEKYRPENLEDFACDQKLKVIVSNWIKEGQCPNITFSGPAGTGKTTLARIIAKGLNSQVLELNASDERGIEVIRDKVKRFAMMQTHGRLKIIFLDEADNMTPDAQWTARGVIERVSKNTRFILTANYLNRIIPEIQSRCKIVKIVKLPKKEIGKRCLQVLTKENISFDVHDVKKVIELHYPDMREILNTLQLYSIDGKLQLDITKVIDSNYKLKILNAIKKKKFKEVRQIIQNEHIDYVDMYHYLFNSFDDNRRLMLIIADHLATHIHNPDPEINFCAMIIEIMEKI